MLVNKLNIAQYSKFSGAKLNCVQNNAVQKPISKSETNKLKACYNTSFGHIEQDFYPISYIDKYIRPEVIQNALKARPEIANILKSYGIEPKVSKTNIDESLKYHLLATYLYTKELAAQSNLSFQQKETLYKAALLHDIGKALIPERIMQKPGKLTETERKIVDLHALLGCEILKTTDVGKDVAELVRLHHMPANHPNSNAMSEILSVADVYSALREKRIYKPPISPNEAFQIMEKDPKLAQKYISILKKLHADN